MIVSKDVYSGECFEEYSGCGKFCDYFRECPLHVLFYYPVECETCHRLFMTDKSINNEQELSDIINKLKEVTQ